MNLDLWKKRKKELGYSFERLSELSGVPLGTIQKIFTGETKNPREATINALENILLYRPSVISDYHYPSADEIYELREAAPEYMVNKRQGEYTVEDYLSWPEEHRIELIDGVIYDMSGCAFAHQMIVTEMVFQLMSYIKSIGDDCIPFVSPVDVQLDCDNKTMVQPDVGVICHPEQLEHGRVYGAPDFIVEIISPTTRRKDMTTKLEKYQNAGVREYWMVDIYQGRVLVYFFEAEDYPVIYGANDQIPVGIYNGDLCIDMSEMKEAFTEKNWRR